MEEIPEGFDGLVYIANRLLGPGGCPWDKAQTHESLKRHLIEETYETVEAIDAKDPERLKEELGDLILQPVMHAQMSAAAGGFDIQDVIETVKQKLVRRHPHVFGDVNESTPEQVLANWDEIKRMESGWARSAIGGVPKSLPSLLRAFEISKRAARAGFEWPSKEAVMHKVFEELNELRAAELNADKAEIEAELGDFLFALVNLCRWLDVEPEDALRKMIDRFVRRFEMMERTAQKPLKQMTAEEWDDLWNQAKAAER